MADEVHDGSLSDRADRWLGEGAHTKRGRLKLGLFSATCWIVYGVSNLDEGPRWLFGTLAVTQAVLAVWWVVQLLRDREPSKGY